VTTCTRQLLSSLISTGFRRPSAGGGAFLAIGHGARPRRSSWACPHSRRHGIGGVCTAGSGRIAQEKRHRSDVVFKLSEQRSPSTIDVIRSGRVDLVINIPEEYSGQGGDRWLPFAAAGDRPGGLPGDQLQLAKALVNALFRAGDEA